MNKKITQLSASLLLALPIIAFAQSHGGGTGGPPAGIGGGSGGPPAGIGGGIGGAVSGIGHAGGIGGSVPGSASGGASGHASDMTSLSGTGLSKAQAHRLELQARKDAAAAKAAEAEAQGAAHANANAVFGQSTAATARTLKDADAATRAAFHDTVTAGAKLQGKGEKSGSDNVTDSDDGETETETETETSATIAGMSNHAGAAGSAQTGADHANANAQFGQDTAAQARTLKDADAATRQAFGGTVSGSAKLKSADKKTAKTQRTR